MLCAWPTDNQNQKNSESIKLTQLTVMQLIATETTKVEVTTSGKKPISHCKLVYNNVDSISPACMQPHCIINRCWSEIKN